MMLRLSVALCFLVAAPAHAQPKPAPKPAPLAGAEDMAAFERDLNALFTQGGLTADQAAARASKVSPSVLRRAAEVEAAIASAQAAELVRVPQVGAKASFTYLSPVDPIMFGPGISIEVPNKSTVLQASIAVPLSDYLLRFPKIIDAAKLGMQVALASKQSTEINAGQEARLAYYEWLRARLQVLIAERQHAQVKAVLKQVRALAEAQRLSKADLMRVESNEAQAEQVVNQLRNLAALREEQLRLLIGARGEESLALGEDPRGKTNVPNAAKLDELVARATQHRLEFRVLDLGIAAKMKQREAESANKLPRLAAFAQADYDNPNQRIFPQEEKFQFTWLVGAQVTWTLNDTLIARATERRIAAETDQLRADRENLLRGTRIEVLAAQQAVLLAQSALATTQKGLAAAEEGYRVRRELLNAERATAVELVDAETDLTRARIAALNARVDLRVALAQLAHALGEDAAAVH